ncbi:hypothetical protein, partial [Streptomyces nigra]
YKQRYADGETLDDLLPEAFATVREAAKRVLGTPFPTVRQRTRRTPSVHARTTGGRFRPVTGDPSRDSRTCPLVRRLEVFPRRGPKTIGTVL